MSSCVVYIISYFFFFLREIYLEEFNDLKMSFISIRRKYILLMLNGISQFVNENFDGNWSMNL